MKKLFILSKAYRKIDEYADKYEDFYVQMYSDTGLWNEDALIISYGEQAEMRKQEIYMLLRQKFSPDIVVGYHIEKGLHISWRSKDIWVKWRDDGDTRTITELEIR